MYLPPGQQSSNEDLSSISGVVIVLCSLPRNAKEKTFGELFVILSRTFENKNPVSRFSQPATAVGRTGRSHEPGHERPSTSRLIVSCGEL